MIENLCWLVAGVVLGATYHAKVQPVVRRVWASIKAWASDAMSRPRE